MSRLLAVAGLAFLLATCAPTAGPAGSSIAAEPSVTAQAAASGTPSPPSRSPLSSPSPTVLPTASPAQSDTPAPTSDTAIFFVPIGDFPSATLEDLVSYYRDTYQLSIKILPPVELTPSAFDPTRQQLIAEQVIHEMAVAYQEITDDRTSTMIGLTTADMYIQAKANEWRFAFGFRRLGRFGVISSARMEIGVSARNPDLLETRIRKMATRYIGRLYYGYPFNDDPHSVLYADLLGLDDLDTMGEEL